MLWSFLPLQKIKNTSVVNNLLCIYLILTQIIWLLVLVTQPKPVDNETNMKYCARIGTITLPLILRTHPTLVPSGWVFNPALFQPSPLAPGSVSSQETMGVVMVP